MTDDLIARADEILKHSGVKGMKWGQRRSHFEAQQQAKSDKKEQKVNKKNWERKVKAEKKWAVDAKDPKTLIAVHNRAATQYNTIDIPKINNKKEYRNHDMRQADHPLTKKYFKEHEDAFNKRRDEALDSMVGKSALGLSLRIRPDGTTYFIELKHVDQPTGIIVKFDESGHIVKFVVTDPEMAHMDSAAKGLEFIDHSGVKGMRWGVRRSRKEPKTGHVIKIGERKPSGTPQPGVDRTTGVRTHPGKMRPGARKYDVKDLSNEDLKRIVARMKLESDYAALNDKNKGMGKKFVDDLIAQAPKLILAGIEAKGKQTVKEQLGVEMGKNKDKKNKDKKNKNKGSEED